MPIFHHRPLAPDDPQRMYLSPEELNWARTIRQRANALPELENKLNDFQCAQLALLEHDSYDAALQRALHLQSFRKEYGVIDTYEAGKRSLKTFIESFPKHWLSFSFHREKGSYVFCYNMKEFNPRLLNTPDKLNNFMTANYYMLNCLTVDMSSIRQGSSVMAECSGYDWTQNIDIELYKKVFRELVVAYPIRLANHKHFNSGVLVNILYSMTKRIFPAHIRETFEVGNHLDDGQTLDEIFLVPTVESASERVLKRLAETLKLRYEHERTFRLEPSSS